MINAHFRTMLLVALAGGTVACNQGSSAAAGGDEGLAAFNKDSLAGHIRVLASDSFQGRRPFTTGEKRTIDSLVSSYTSLGLEPGNGTSYTQDVPMVEISPAGTTAMKIESPKAPSELKSLEDL